LIIAVMTVSHDRPSQERATEVLALTRKTVRKKKYSVFLSHASKDNWIARQMAGRLEDAAGKAGVQVFLDERVIEGGDSISEEIRDGILRCAELLVLLTPHSVDRPWVLIEIGAAWTLRKRIIPVVYNLLPGQMPDVIEPRKAVDLNDFDQCVSQILKRARERKRSP
jgi:hypothetical protein